MATNKGIMMFDLATAAGYAFIQKQGDKPISGAFKVGTNGFTNGRIYRNYLTQLMNIVKFHRPNAICYEAPFIGNMKNSNVARRLMMYIGLVEMVADQYDVSIIRHIHNKTIKEHCTGDGNASKHKMMQFCISKGWNPATDDEADALGGLCVAVSILWGYDL